MTTPAPPPVRALLATWRVAALWIVGVATALFAAMVPWVHDAFHPNAVDRSAADWLWARFGDPQHAGAMTTFLLGFSLPVITVSTTVVVGIVALARRDWPLAVLAAVGPALGLVLESYVLKPAIDRRFGLAETLSDGAVTAGHAFPSGHETGITSVLTLLLVILLRTAAPTAVKIAAVAVSGAWAGLAALGLVAGGYHYFTDTWGGFLLGVVVVLATALVVDAAAARLSSPAGRGRPRTAGAA